MDDFIIGLTKDQGAELENKDPAVAPAAIPEPTTPPVQPDQPTPEQVVNAAVVEATAIPPEQVAAQLPTVPAPAPVQGQPQPKPQSEQQTQDAQPAEQQPAQPTDQPDQPAVEENKESLDTQIDSLLSEIDALNKTNNEEVKTEEQEPNQKQAEIGESLDKIDLGVDEKEEIINYIGELETQVAQHDLSLRTVQVQKEQLEKMLEQERAKTNQLFEQAKELEWEQKKMKTVTPPDEVSNLIDYYRLMKDNPSLYNKRNFIGEIAKLSEQTTEIPLDSYIMDWLSKGDQFNKEEPSSAPTISSKEAEKSGKDWVKAVAF